MAQQTLVLFILAAAMSLFLTNAYARKQVDHQHSQSHLLNQGLDYGEALSKAILFYEAQRSGYLPSHQRVKWRSHSGLEDGKASGIDLVGGYYDAGDNVKFGLPMAFTITMLSWSVSEYKAQMGKSGELGNALEAIKWGTDYFIKAHTEPSVLWAEVGDGDTDHACWQRPEDMTTSRTAYRLDQNNPGSDLAGETAAAMAAASIVFQNEDRAYSNLLLVHARQLFTFADKYRGKYDSSIPIAKKYYASRSGYNDELLWAAAWMYEATNDQYYLDYLANNGDALGGTGWSMREFSWDVKYAGVQVLASKILLEGRAGRHSDVLTRYKSKAEYFLCACLQQNGGANVQRSPGGLMFIRPWNNMQYVTSASFLLTVYSDYLTGANQNLQCPTRHVTPVELLNLAQTQVNYILGLNPRSTSYMVGFGGWYPQQVHHRGSSIVSIKENSGFISCKGGYSTWYSRDGKDPNVLIGALVGGPDYSDNFGDERHNWEQTEPTTYNNGPFIGVLARLHAGTNTKQERTGASLSKVDSLMNMEMTDELSPPKTVEVNQTQTQTWEYEGKTYFRYAVRVTNKLNGPLQELVLRINNFNGQLWGLSQVSDGKYTFPEWMNSLAAEESFEFVYIWNAQPVKIKVESFLKV